MTIFTDKQKIKFLQDFVQIKTVNSNEEEATNYIANLLLEHGIESYGVKYAEGRVSLVADVKGQEFGKLLVLSGHTDVVSEGDENLWTYDPYGAEIVDGKMYGRGTSDMKAGLMALVIAMIELKEEGADFNGTIRLAATIGEEIGMYGSKQLSEEGHLDGANGFIVGEPSGLNEIIYAHKGSLQYEIHAHGKSAHSSMPHLGVDALQLLVDYINNSNEKFAEVFAKGTNEHLGDTLNVNTVINGGAQINSVAEKVVMKANARTIPEVDNQIVLDCINQAIEEINAQSEGHLELNILQNNYFAISKEDNVLIKALQNAAPVENVKPIAISGATDASNFGRISDEYDLAIYGPGSLAQAHTVDEYIDVQEYLDFINIYKTAIKDYLKV